MSKGSILIVDDDKSLTNLLKVYFEAKAYIVQIVSNGSDAIAEAQNDIPTELIVLNMMLPDISGYDVCRLLRTNTTTSNIPIIFLTDVPERSDQIGESFGDDVWLTKPFDVEELLLKIENELNRSRRDPRINPISGFLGRYGIESYLSNLINMPDEWTYVELEISQFSEFKEIYSWHAGDEVIRKFSLIITDVLEGYGSQDDFVGHLDENRFVLISYTKDVKLLIESLRSRFDKEIKGHYSFIDRERGFMFVDGNEVPLMSLAIQYAIRS